MAKGSLCCASGARGTPRHRIAGAGVSTRRSPPTASSSAAIQPASSPVGVASSFARFPAREASLLLRRIGARARILGLLNQLLRERLGFGRTLFGSLSRGLQRGGFLLQLCVLLLGVLLFGARSRHDAQAADVAEAGSLHLFRQRPSPDPLSSIVVGRRRVERVGDAFERCFV